MCFGPKFSHMPFYGLSHGLKWSYLVMFYLVRFSMLLYYVIQFCVVLSSLLWPSIALFGPVLTWPSCMVLYDPVWPPMVFYGPVQSCITLYGYILSFMVLVGTLWTCIEIFCYCLLLYGLPCSCIILYVSLYGPYDGHIPGLKREPGGDRQQPGNQTRKF